MKKAVRKISLILAILTVMNALTGCDLFKSGTETSNTGTDPESSSSTTELITEGGSPAESSPAEEEIPEFLPTGIDLGRSMRILAEKNFCDEWLDSGEGSAVNREIYERVERAEKNLGIELTVLNKAAYKSSNDLEMLVCSTDPNEAVDLVSTQSRWAGHLSYSGAYKDIAASDMIDLEAPWWQESFVKSYSIYDSLYVATGDISPSLLYETHVLFYNTDLIKEYNLRDPVTLVNQRKWTIDKLIEMTSGIYDDRDGTATGVDMGDLFAFGFNDNASIQALVYGAGIRVMTNKYNITEDYTGGNKLSVYYKLQDWIKNNPGVKTPSDLNVNDYGVSFKNNNSIFTLGCIDYAHSELRISDVSYMIVPCPNLKEGEGDYLTSFGSYTSFWGIPVNADLDDSCILLDYLGADAYAYITPAIYDDLASMQKTEEGGETLRAMLKIISDGRVYDQVLVYKTFMTNFVEFSKLANTSKDWQSNFTSTGLKSLQQSAEAIYYKLMNLDKN